MWVTLTVRNPLLLLNQLVDAKRVVVQADKLTDCLLDQFLRDRLVVLRIGDTDAKLGLE